VPQIGESTKGVPETSKLGGTRLIWLFPVGVFTRFNCALVTTQDISIDWVPQIENLPMELGKLQDLVELDLSACSELGCLLDSIVELSELKTFRLFECHKLENLPTELGKIQSLLQLNLSSCFKFAC
jgi:Leucine-rich repeat (LRR) protein